MKLIWKSNVRRFIYLLVVTPCYRYQRLEVLAINQAVAKKQMFGSGTICPGLRLEPKPNREGTTITGLFYDV